MALYDEMGEEGLGSDEEVTLPEQTVTQPTSPGYSDTTEEVQDWQNVDNGGTMEGWKYQDGIWTDPSGKEYDLSYLNIKDKSALSRFISYAKKMFGGEGSTEDYMQLLPFLGGLFGANQSSNASILNPGYQGGIPRVTATRTMLTEPPAGRRPGSGGINYGGDVTYARTGQNLTPENAGISTPVSQPLGGTPTFTQPAAYDLASLAALIRQLREFQEQNKPPAPAPSSGFVTGGGESSVIPTAPPAPAPVPAPSAASAGSGFVTGGGGGNFGGFSTQAEYDAAVAAKKAEDARRRAELEAYTPSAPFLAQYFADPSLIPRMHNESIEDAILRLKAQDKDYTDRLARRTALQNQFAQANPEASARFIVAPNATAAAPTPSPFTTGGGAPATTPTPGPSQVIADETGFTPPRDYGFTPTPGPSQVIADETGFTPPRDYASSTAQPINDLQGLFQQVYGRAGTDAEVQNLAGKSTDEARGILENSIANWRASQQQPMYTANPNQSLIEAARGGLLPDGFVIPADVVSHLGNGSSEAGLDYLAEYLNAKPIKGKGDGMSDSIPTTIGGKQPARVANEEAFVPPEVVKKLGGGDTDRGAKKLYAMMDRIRKARTGTTEQGKEINPEKFMPGGKVNRYAVGGTTTGATAGGGLASQSLADWVGPYVADMLGKGQALAESPYQAYTGPLTAGASPLQQQSFQAAGNLQVPTQFGQAAGIAGAAGQRALDVGYTPVGQSITGGPLSQPISGAPTSAVPSMTGTQPVSNIAQAYMNPYLESVLNPQLRELTRQADITRAADAARMAKAGAFGGSRQAIMESEGRRNLMQQQSDVLGQGYATAYDKALAQFNAEQARKIAEAQFGTTTGLEGIRTGLQGAQTLGQLGNLQQQSTIDNLRALAEAGAAQRGIEAEGIAADKAQFEEARLNPYKMLQFQQSLLSGLPLASQSLYQPGMSNLDQFGAGFSSVAKLLQYFYPNLFKDQATTTKP